MLPLDGLVLGDFDLPPLFFLVLVLERERLFTFLLVLFPESGEMTFWEISGSSGIRTNESYPNLLQLLPERELIYDLLN